MKQKTITITWQMQDKNSTIFYYKNETKTEQGCNKKIPKTNVEHIKGNEEFYFYLYPLGI
jgi:hypothetical protein